MRCLMNLLYFTFAYGVAINISLQFINFTVNFSSAVLMSQYFKFSSFFLREMLCVHFYHALDIICV